MFEFKHGIGNDGAPRSDAPLGSDDDLRDDGARFSSARRVREHWPSHLSRRR
jgi:hypothetical protein